MKSKIFSEILSEVTPEIESKVEQKTLEIMEAKFKPEEIYINLKNCSEEQIKYLTSILQKAGEHICYPIEKDENHLLSFSPHCNGWNVFREVYSKQEITYTQFLEMMGGETSAEAEAVYYSENEAIIPIDCNDEDLKKWSDSIQKAFIAGTEYATAETSK